jgi:hypothetical protein
MHFERNLGLATVAAKMPIAYENSKQEAHVEANVV